MRTILTHVAWTLAAVALVIATPVQAASTRGDVTTPVTMGAGTTNVVARPHAAPAPAASSPAATRGAVSSAFTTATPRPPRQANLSPTRQQQDTGQGWDELYCMACVGLGTLALYSGGITMLPVILGNASMYGTLTGTCLLACESAVKSLLR